MNYKMLITPFVAYVVNSSEVDWKDPFNLWTVRVVYACSLVFAIITKLLVHSKVNAKHDDRRVRIPAKTQYGVEKPARELSVTEYDREALSAQIKAIIISTFITVFLHLRNEWVLPMIISSVHQNLLMTYDSPLFQIYVLGYSDSGNSPLKRPWNPNTHGFQEIIKQAQAMQEKSFKMGDKKQKSGKSRSR